MTHGATVAGSCLCRSVRFRVELPSLFCAHCHCTMCQRSHGAPFVTWFAVPRERFVLQADETLTRYRSSDHGTRSFCRRCGSTLFCESTHSPRHIDIVLANMEGAIDRRPECHVYYDSRAPWIDLSDALPRTGGEGGLEPLPSEEAS